MGISKGFSELQFHRSQQYEVAARKQVQSRASGIKAWCPGQEGHGPWHFAQRSPSGAWHTVLGMTFREALGNVALPLVGHSPESEGARKHVE